MNALTTTNYEQFLPKEFLALIGVTIDVDHHHQAVMSNGGGSGSSATATSTSTTTSTTSNSTSRELSLMLANFQSLVNSAEKMQVQDSFEFFNATLGRIGTPIYNNKGFIHQFLGDTLTALFTGDADDVIKAAIQVINTVKDIQQEKKMFVNKRQQDIRIGLHHGSMKLGTVRLAPSRMDTSFVSPIVPITRQLELFAKTFNTPIITSHLIMNRLKRKEFENPNITYCSLGRFMLKELGATLELFQLYDKRWDAALYSDERKKQFTKGIEMFQQRKFVAAMTTFTKLYKQNEEDIIAHFYSKVSKMYQQVQPPQNWDGYILVDRDCKPNPIGSKTNSFYLQTGISAYHHFGDEQLLSNGKDKEEEIKLLNDSLNQKSVTLRDMKEILSVKEQEIARLQEITEVLMREKRVEVEKLRQQVEQLRSRLGEGQGHSEESSSSSLFAKCFPCIMSPKGGRIAPMSDNMDNGGSAAAARRVNRNGNHSHQQHNHHNQKVRKDPGW